MEEVKKRRRVIRDAQTQKLTHKMPWSYTKMACGPDGQNKIQKVFQFEHLNSVAERKPMGTC